MLTFSTLFLFLTTLTLVFSVVEEDEVLALPGWDGPLPSSQYSGLLEIPNTNPKRYYHYWLVTSEKDAINDPIVWWFNGGPGASSLMGYFTELGPFHLNEDSLIYNTSNIPKLFYNNYTWSKIANLVFLESPASVGFSYCDGKEGPIYSCPVWNDTLTAEDNHAAMQQFFKSYPEYLSNEFYITGESYAGIYIPTLVMQIENDPSNLPKLMGFAIGNGCMGINGKGGCNNDLQENFLQVMWGHGQLSNDLSKKIQIDCGNCLEWGNCTMQNEKCLYDRYLAVEAMGGWNIYNLYDECIWNRKEYIRYNSYITNFNAKMKSGINKYSCGGEYVTSIYLNLDIVKTSINMPNIKWKQQDLFPKYISTQTDLRGYYYNWVNKYRILIYNGDVDTSVPYIGSELWTQNLGYNIIEKWRAWTINGYNLMGGYVQTYNVSNYFVFCTIRGAGHMVPMYKPKQAFAMFKFWLYNLEFPKYSGVTTVKYF